MTLTDVQRQDAELGMAWWNALTRPVRAYWLERASSDVPAQAWAAYKAMLNPARAESEVPPS